jgi:hypothetical protein
MKMFTESQYKFKLMRLKLLKLFRTYLQYLVTTYIKLQFYTLLHAFKDGRIANKVSAYLKNST